MSLPTLPVKTGHLFIALAVILGVVTIGVFGSGKKHTQKISVEPAMQTQWVVVPVNMIGRGTVLNAKDLTQVKWPAQYLPPGDFFTETAEVLGRTARQDLFPGEPLFSQKVSGGQSRGGLPALIPAGKRAITIAVTEIKGVAGFVKPGDRVDVLTTFDVETEDGKADNQSTQTLLQNVLVLASAQSLDNTNPYTVKTPSGIKQGYSGMPAMPEEGGKKPLKSKKESAKDLEKAAEKSAKEQERAAKEEEQKRRKAEKNAKLVSSVTLAVSPGEAEKLAMAEEAGMLRLVLRPENDYRTQALAGSSKHQLTGKPAMASTRSTPKMTRPVGRPTFIPPSPPVFNTVLNSASNSNSGGIEFIQGTEKTTVNPDSPL